MAQHSTSDGEVNERMLAGLGHLLTSSSAALAGGNLGDLLHMMPSASQTVSAAVAATCSGPAAKKRRLSNKPTHDNMLSAASAADIEHQPTLSPFITGSFLCSIFF